LSHLILGLGASPPYLRYFVFGKQINGMVRMFSSESAADARVRLSKLLTDGQTGAISTCPNGDQGGRVGFDRIEVAALDREQWHDRA
jgi:hypothetical protein